MSASLQVEHVSKSFGGVAALRDVSFEAPPGSVVGLIGPNGAGKSTLFNVLTNIERSEGGRVRIDGRDTEGLMPHQVAALGVARTFQTARAFPHLSVRANILVGGYLVRPPGGAIGELLGLRSASALGEKLGRRADALIEAFRLDRWADSGPSGLPPAAAKYVDMARALMGNPRLLLLDEPAAGLNDKETAEMGEAIQAARDLGITVVIVEHNMSLLFGVADSVVVLDAGEVIAAGAPDDVRRDERVIAAYFGAASGAHRA